jgi:hypothetical protein
MDGAAFKPKPTVLFAELHVRFLEAGSNKIGQGLPESSQGPVQLQESRVVALGGLVPVEFGPGKRGRVLRIRNQSGVPAHPLKLLDAPLSSGLPKLRFRMRGEELPGRCGTVFLPHKQHGRERGGQRQNSSQGQLTVGKRLREPVTDCSVADLVVVLGAHNQGGRMYEIGVDGAAMVPAAET